MWEELSNIQTTNHTVEELLAERETNRIIDFLMGLNDNYESIRSRILMKKTLPSFSEIYNLLDQEDSQKEACIQLAAGANTAAAFQVSQSPASTHVNSTGYQRKDRPYCSFCHRPGHVVDRCYKKHGYPNSMKPSPKVDSIDRFSPAVSANIAVNDSVQLVETTSEDLSPQQIQQLVSFLSNKLQPPASHPIPEVHSVSASIPSSSSTTCPISGNFHPSILCSFTGLDRPYVCSTNQNITALNAWVIDSGATNHICHQKSSFLSFKSLPDTSVSLPNGVMVDIVGIGSIELGSDLRLSDVLYIPQFKFNLLSVSCLTKRLHCRLWFDEFSGGIQDPTRELMIGMGREVANLYFLDIESLSSPDISSPIIVASVSSLDMWHKRLGHPSMSKLQTMQNILDFRKQSKSDIHCKVWHLSKQKHLPFTSQNNLSGNPFDHLHIDTWGPFSVPTHDGFRYFLTIVDDCSRATWVYLLKSKSDVLTVFPNFIAMVETQFDRRVKAVRSDNAPELKFTSFYNSKGIISYHSCPETPQQNSAVERKHQHILNVARSLLFQSHIPLSYWGDCILTAVHLINRLPAPILNDKSSFEKLTNKIPDYTQLKSFGCLCYISTSPKNRHKFDPRAKACILIGYPADVKGYKLLDIENNSIHISRHVVFHEELFPLVGSDLSSDFSSFFPDQIPKTPGTSLPDDETSSHSFSVENLPTAVPIDVTEPSVQTSNRRSKQPAYLKDYYCNAIGSSTLHEISQFLSYGKISPLYLSFLVAID